MSHERARTVVAGGVLAASAVAAPFLPGALPSGFGVPPGPAAWISRLAAALFLPLAALACSALLRQLAASDPARANHRRFQGTFDLAVDVAVGFILGLHVTLLATLLLGPRPWLGRVPPALVGVALVVVGNALPRVRPNAVLGVPTTWARESERAWAATHRVGGYLVVTFGLAVMVSAFAVRSGLGAAIGIGVAVIAVLLAIVSWLASFKEGSACPDSALRADSSPPRSPSSRS